jgi:iron complex outermembrane receptor protein
MYPIRHNRLAIALSAVLLGGLALAAPATARAQDNAAPNPAPKTTTQLGEVQVTGSRIKGADMATQVPVLTITSEDIQKTGLTGIGDILQQLSSSGAGLNTKFNSAGNFGTPPDGGGVGSGSSTLDLRNLGANRVLVLVDGVRWVNESSGSGVSAAVDLNTIPASIIDRIEILQDGASALYGSDAIAGVVNIITKHAQKGASINAYYGTYNNLGGGGTSSADVSFGGTGDRYEFFVDFSHTKQNSISASEYGPATVCVPGTGLTNCSSGPAAGRFIFTDPNTGQSRDLVPNAGVTGTLSYPDDFHKFSSADRYNFAPGNLLLTPNERSAVFAQLRYHVTDNITWYTRGLYNNRKSANQAAPSPRTLGPDSGSGTFVDTIGIDATNPYNPFGFSLDPATNFSLISRRLVEGGPRLFEQDVDTTYFGTGLQGNFGVGEHDFYWDVNYANGINKAVQQQLTGATNARNIQRALGPLADCTGTCVPLDLFGAGSITPEMLDYIHYVPRNVSQNKIQLWTANLSGDLFELPAGAFSFASGLEHRNYEGYYQPDALAVSGDSGGLPVLPTSGSYSINEYYLELNVPLLKDLPGFKALDLSAATRYSDYSTFGGTTNSKLGLRWQVFNDLTLRSTLAQGFRAPSIGELFASASNFGAQLRDPCSAPIAGGQAASSCAALGVPAGYTQRDPQIDVRTGGNPDLHPETSRSLTAGAVYSPSWAVNSGWANKLDLNLEYYRIKLSNAIQALDAQTLLNRCVESGSPTSEFCSGIHRGATGNIDNFNDTLRNIGQIDTRGWDFGATWRSPETPIGVFNANWQNTYVTKYIAGDAGGDVEPRTVGLELKDSSIPRLTSVLMIGWDHGAWNATTTFRYFSGLNEDCALAGGFDICSQPDEITPTRPNGTHRFPSVTYQDLRASWKLPVKLDLTLTAGINNLWDKQPPICLSCTLNGYDASTYDLPSRFMYLQANLKF